MMADIWKYLPTFLTSSLLSYLADRLGLTNWTRELLSSVLVKHLLPPPPPCHAISYREPPSEAYLQVEHTGYAPTDLQVLALPPVENISDYIVGEPFFNISESMTPAQIYQTMILICILAICTGFVMSVYFCRLYLEILASRKNTQPRLTLIDLASSDGLEHINVEDFKIDVNSEEALTIVWPSYGSWDSVAISPFVRILNWVLEHLLNPAAELVMRLGPLELLVFAIKSILHKGNSFEPDVTALSDTIDAHDSSGSLDESDGSPVSSITAENVDSVDERNASPPVSLDEDAAVVEVALSPVNADIEDPSHASEVSSVATIEAAGIIHNVEDAVSTLDSTPDSATENLPAAQQPAGSDVAEVLMPDSVSSFGLDIGSFFTSPRAHELEDPLELVSANQGPEVGAPVIESVSSFGVDIEEFFAPPRIHESEDLSFQLPTTEDAIAHTAPELRLPASSAGINMEDISAAPRSFDSVDYLERFSANQDSDIRVPAIESASSFGVDIAEFFAPPRAHEDLSAQFATTQNPIDHAPKLLLPVSSVDINMEDISAAPRSFDSVSSSERVSPHQNQGSQALRLADSGSSFGFDMGEFFAPPHDSMDVAERAIAAEETDNGICRLPDSISSFGFDVGEFFALPQARAQDPTDGPESSPCPCPTQHSEDEVHRLLVSASSFGFDVEEFFALPQAPVQNPTDCTESSPSHCSTQHSENEVHRLLVSASSFGFDVGESFIPRACTDTEDSALSGRGDGPLLLVGNDDLPGQPARDADLSVDEVERLCAAISGITLDEVSGPMLAPGTSDASTARHYFTNHPCVAPAPVHKPDEIDIVERADSSNAIVLTGHPTSDPSRGDALVVACSGLESTEHDVDQDENEVSSSTMVRSLSHACTSVGDAWVFEPEQTLSSAGSFSPYTPGTPLAAIPEDNESVQDHLSTPSSPLVEIRLEEELTLATSPCFDSSLSMPDTPCNLGIVLSCEPESPRCFEDAREIFGSPTLPTAFPLIRRDKSIAQALHEDINDWDWTLLNIALHEQAAVVRHKAPGFTVQPSIHSADDPFMVASTSVAGWPYSGFESPASCIDDDHRRVFSDPIRRIQDFLRVNVDAPPHSLTLEQATMFPKLCGTLGLILPDRSARAYYSMAGYHLSLQAEKQSLALATVPRLHRRHSSVMLKPSVANTLPHGYGLSRHSFLRMFNALFYSPDMTYAHISRRGISPSPTVSPAAVSTPGAFDTGKIAEQGRGWVTLNRSRGGSDINLNGTSLKAQPPVRSLRQTRSLGSLMNPTARQKLHSVRGQDVSEVPGAGRGRTTSPSPKVAHSVWVRDKVSENRVGSASVPSSPAFGSHQRYASQAASSESSAADSPAVSQWQGVRGRKDKQAAPRAAPLASSAMSSSSVAGENTRGQDKGKGRAREHPAAETRKAHIPRSCALGSVISSAKNVFLARESDHSVYARVDDESAVSRFEEEQGLL